VFIEWLAVLLFSTALTAALTLEHWTVRADNLAYDALAKLATHPPGDDIVIVSIDNRSIAALGRWPWPRQLHVQLLRRLAEMKPKAIAYDVLFVDPDRDPSVDKALADAIRTASPTFLPILFDVPGPNGAPFRVTPPSGALSGAAAGLGHVNVALDDDGVVRRAFLVEGDHTQSWPHLMSLLHDVAAGVRPPGAPMAGIPDARGPQLSRPIMIAFAGPPGTFRTISAVDLIRGETPPAFVRNKLVLVGSTADGLGDQYPTPLSAGGGAMPGVEIQANLIETLNANRAIRPLGAPWMLVFALAPLWLLLLAFLRLPPRANMFLGGTLIVAVLAVSGTLFLAFSLWAPPVAPLTGLVLVYAVWSWRRLAASTAFLVDELKQFADEPDLLSALTDPVGDLPGDLVERHVILMRRAIGRARDLRAFVTDGLNGLPDPVFLAGPDERVIIANRAAEALFQSLANGPAQGAYLAALRRVLRTPDGSARSPEWFAGEAEDGELAAPDGRVFNVSRTALQRATGQTVAWAVRLSDITAIKAAAQHREDILQLLTHDMRSPQVSILTLLAKADSSELPAGLATRIDGYAHRTLALADEFVHLARAERADYALETVNLSDLLQDAIDDLWPQSSAKSIVVSVHGGEGEYLVEAERSLLTRVFINLIDNALKFTEPGGRVDCRLGVATSASRREAVCSIADTGRGMSADQCRHVFDRFRMGRGVGSSGEGHGTGLGLAFVQAVITRHGGSIECASEPDKGAVFTLTLPLAGEG